MIRVYATLATQGMTFFPIVQRELQVAARSRRQFRLRMLVATGSTFLGGFSALIWSFHAAAPMGGGLLFTALSSAFWLICLGSGIFLTADCISREKREGTLGLLFLTDLRGYDVVLGKLASTSLMTVVMLVGALPVLSLCVLMGGVSGAMLWRVCVSLLLTMLFSLSLGMFVSTFVRESWQAGTITFLFLCALAVGLPLLAGVATLLPASAGRIFYFVNFASPAFLAQTASLSPGLSTHFSTAATIVFLASLTLLALSSVRVRRSWQDRPAVSAGLSPEASEAPLSRPAARRDRELERDPNPLLRLTGDDTRPGWTRAVVLFIALTGAAFAMPDELRQLLPVLQVYVFPYVLAAFIATRAAGFFVHLRQHGALELLLSTPLTDGEILGGQWLALRRRYLPVATVLVMVIWLPELTYRALPNIQGFPDSERNELAGRFYLTVRSLLLWGAAGWAGIYFGLKTRRTQFAGLLALLVGVALPWMSWCVPEILTSLTVLSICRESLRDRVRRIIVGRIESGGAP